eukprot:768145-Hanusia_phi.AAC.2
MVVVDQEEEDQIVGGGEGRGQRADRFRVLNREVEDTNGGEKDCNPCDPSSVPDDVCKQAMPVSVELLEALDVACKEEDNTRICDVLDRLQETNLDVDFIVKHVGKKVKLLRTHSNAEVKKKAVALTQYWKDVVKKKVETSGKGTGKAGKVKKEVEDEALVEFVCPPHKTQQPFSHRSSPKIRLCRVSLVLSFAAMLWPQTESYTSTHHFFSAVDSAKVGKDSIERLAKIAVWAMETKRMV